MTTDTVMIDLNAVRQHLIDRAGGRPELESQAEAVAEAVNNLEVAAAKLRAHLPRRTAATVRESLNQMTAAAAELRPLPSDVELKRTGVAYGRVAEAADRYQAALAAFWDAAKAVGDTPAEERVIYRVVAIMYNEDLTPLGGFAEDYPTTGPVAALDHFTLANPAVASKPWRWDLRVIRPGEGTPPGSVNQPGPKTAADLAAELAWQPEYCTEELTTGEWCGTPLVVCLTRRGGAPHAECPTCYPHAVPYVPVSS